MRSAFEKYNIVVSSGFFINESIWSNLFPLEAIICCDSLRGLATSNLSLYITRLLEELDPEKETILVGHSYGAGLLLALLNRIKLKVKAFYLLNGIVPISGTSIFEAYFDSQQSLLSDMVRLDSQSALLQLFDKRLYCKKLCGLEAPDIELNNKENVLMVSESINYSLTNRNFLVNYIASGKDEITPLVTQKEFSTRINADSFICLDNGGHLSAFLNKHWLAL